MNYIILIRGAKTSIYDKNINKKKLRLCNYMILKTTLIPNQLNFIFI